MNELIPPAGTSPLELAGALGITDPNVLRVLEMMSAQQNEQEESVAHENQAGTGDREKYDKLLRENRMLLQENKYLITQVETLAAALGACPACWGEDQACSQCRGRGAPGAYPPDRQTFADFVLPVLRRKAKRARTHRRTADAQQPGELDKNGKLNPKSNETV